MHKQPSTLRLPPSASGESKNGGLDIKIQRSGESLNSERPVEKATAETYVNNLLSRLWDAPQGKVRDLGSPLTSAAPHRGALHNKSNGGNPGVSKHAHVSFNVIEGEDGFED